MKILIVDDSAIIRRVLKNNLLELLPESEFVEAEDGADGLAKLKNSMPVDMIFLDINMPHMKGDAFLKKVRERAEYNKIKIIMATTEAEKSTVIKMMKMGANGYLVKPFNAENIKRSLTPILERMGIEI